MTDETLERLLRAIVREEIAPLADRIDRLDAAVRALAPRKGPDDAALVHAIVVAIGGRPFTAAELLERAEALAAEGEALRAAIGSRNSRKLGKLFERIEGVEFDGLRVHRVRPISGVMIWVIKGG